MKATLVILFVVFTVIACEDDMNPRPLNELIENDFLFVPEYPESSDEIFMITYDCKYNYLAYISIMNKNILVKKRFNSMMRLPCELSYDTISLGQLSAGIYDVVLQIVDTNPLEIDSVFSEKKQKLRILE